MTKCSNKGLPDMQKRNSTLCYTLFFPSRLYQNRYSMGKIKFVLARKRLKNKTRGLSYFKNMANFEACIAGIYSTKNKPLTPEEWSVIGYLLLFFPGLPFLSSTLTLQSMGRRQNSKHYFWTQSINFGKGRKKEKWTSFSQLHCWKLTHS